MENDTVFKSFFHLQIWIDETTNVYCCENKMQMLDSIMKICHFNSKKKKKK